MDSQVTVLHELDNDTTGPLLDAYRALESVLDDAGKRPLCDLLHVLNDRLEQVLTSGGAQ